MLENNNSRKNKLSHIDEYNNPSMVNISDKNLSTREAVAVCNILLPIGIEAHIQNDDIQTKKGAIFQTARLAGIMATKQTFATIPLCHQIPIEGCDIVFERNFIKVTDETHKEINRLCVNIKCSVYTTAKTGIEMEALHGASIAALTIYDMCKALGSRDMVIEQLKLVKKIGGKEDFYL